MLADVSYWDDSERVVSETTKRNLDSWRCSPEEQSNNLERDSPQVQVGAPSTPSPAFSGSPNLELVFAIAVSTSTHLSELVTRRYDPHLSSLLRIQAPG